MTQNTSTSRPGIMKSFVERMDRGANAAALASSRQPDYAVTEDPSDPDVLLIPLDGEPHLKVRIRRTNYGFVTRHRDQRTDPGLTRARWYRDEDGMVRAHCRWDRGTQWEDEGVLVVAMLHDLRDGDRLTRWTSRTATFAFTGQSEPPDVRAFR